MASSRLRAPASSRWQLPELVVGATTTPMSGKQILRRPAEIMHTDTAPGQCVRLAARLDNGFGEVCKSFACARVASVRDHLSVLESSGDDLDSSKAHCCQSVRRGAELSCAPIKRERASESGLDRWRKVLHQRCKSYHSSERAPQSGRLWGLRRSFSVALSAPEICSKISRPLHR